MRINGTTLSMHKAYQYSDADISDVVDVINSASKLYKDVVPSKALRDPFVDKKYILDEFNDGVSFILMTKPRLPVAVMGYQIFDDAFLIRHAYVVPEFQRMGYAQYLLDHIMLKAYGKQVLLGCFKDATWAVSFYRKNGFTEVDCEQALCLRRKYWRYGSDHISCSIVMRKTESGQRSSISTLKSELDPDLIHG
jgi:GNAT superfamily N-acetyltransferase